MPDDDPHREHAVQSTRQNFHRVQEGLRRAEVHVNGAVWAWRDVRKDFRGGNIFPGGVVYHVEVVSRSAINRELPIPAVFLKTRRFCEQKMDFVRPRRDWIIALKHATASRGKKLGIFRPLNNVAAYGERFSARTVAIAHPGRSSAIDIWTQATPHHGAQDVSRRDSRNSASRCLTNTFLNGVAAPPVPGIKREPAHCQCQNRANDQKPDARSSPGSGSGDRFLSTQNNWGRGGERLGTMFYPGIVQNLFVIHSAVRTMCCVTLVQLHAGVFRFQLAPVREFRNVASRRQTNPNRMLRSGAPIVVVQPLSQRVSSDSDNGVHLRIKIRRAPESLHGDVVLLNFSRRTLEVLFTDVGQKSN